MEDLIKKMEKSIEALEQQLSKIRTGRASPSLLDMLKVDYYGTPTAVNQVASVNVEDSRSLSVTPWEASMVEPIAKAIMTSSLGVTPNINGNMIHINLPPLTEERRKEFVKVAKEEAENTKVAIRNLRRDENNIIKNDLKDKSISEDEAKSLEDEVQKLTDDFITKVDQSLKLKEASIMDF